RDAIRRSRDERDARAVRVPSAHEREAKTRRAAGDENAQPGEIPVVVSIACVHGCLLVVPVWDNRGLGALSKPGCPRAWRKVIAMDKPPLVSKHLARNLAALRQVRSLTQDALAKAA